MTMSTVSCPLEHPILEHSLRAFYGDPTLKITEVVTTKADLNGVGLTSVPSYIDVTFRTEIDAIQTIHLFLKQFRGGEQYKKFVEESKLHIKEEKLYTELLPVYRQIIKTASDPSALTLEFIPRPIYVNNDKILLENLVKEHGYRMLPPILTIGHDLPKIHSVLDALAKFHCLSYVLKNRETIPLTDRYDYLNNNFYAEGIKTALGGFVEKSLQLLADFTKEIPGYENYSEKITRINPVLYEAVLEASKPEEPLNVICHGDCWNNNILFNDKDEMKLLDFQVLRFVPLTCDLLHYMFSSIRPQFRKPNVTTFLRFYYDKFGFYTHLFGDIPLFSFESLCQSFEDRKLFGLFYSLPFLVNGFLPRDEIPDENEASGGTLASMFEMGKIVLKKPEIREQVLEYVKETIEEVTPAIDRYLMKNDSNSFIEN